MDTEYWTGPMKYWEGPYNRKPKFEIGDYVYACRKGIWKVLGWQRRFADKTDLYHIKYALEHYKDPGEYAVAFKDMQEGDEMGPSVYLIQVCRDDLSPSQKRKDVCSAHYCFKVDVWNLKLELEVITKNYEKIIAELGG